ncbi:hypothetical protein [Dactylosporangium sp. NPDC000521]|uniref:hypothetical protein n=1 Tax=Dactylosporangium sp. NPDC000521 TaxID=3363975 RepID=UPI0036B03A22
MFALFWRRIPALLLSCAVLLGTVSACNHREAAPGADGGTETVEAPGADGGDTELVKALSRLADTEDFRKNILFADEAVALRFPRVTSDRAVNWRTLIGRGSARLRPETKILPDYGIRLDNSEYVVTAGTPLRDVTLVAGGQDPAAVTGKLLAAGWRAEDGDLVAPPIFTDDWHMRFLSIALPLVHGEGVDLFVGGDDANWDDARVAPERSLAANPTIRALADCLGDAIAAYFRTRTHDDRTFVIAAGVQRKGAGSGKPAKVVVCSSWSTAEDMDRSVAEQRQQYAQGRPAEVFRDVMVTAVGGERHLVRVTADSREPDAILAMVDDANAPGMHHS